MSNQVSPPASDGTPPWRAGLLLAVMAIIGVGLLAGVHDLTKDRIAEQERQQMLRQLAEVMPAERYDNDVLEDKRLIQDAEAFGHNEELRLFLARKAGEPAGVIMEVIAPNGYNGNITLLMGLTPQGEVTGVRVLSHRETPGLGDPIEKRRSDWIDSFNGRSLGDPPAAAWTVRKDGGDFDQFTGATITPRAVTMALARSLTWYDSQGDALFEGGEANEQSD